MKKMIALLLALVMIFGLVACGNADAPVADAPVADAPVADAPVADAPAAGDSKVISDAKAELRVMLDITSPTLRTLAEEYYVNYKEYFPNFEVEFDLVTETYADKLTVACASGDMPDIYAMMGMSTAIDTGNAMVLDDLIEKYNWKENLVSGASLIAYQDGKIYSLQDGRDAYYVPQIWYNKEIFAAAGCEVPETWDEFLEVVQKLKDYGVVPIAMQNGYPLDCWIQVLVQTHDKDAFTRLAKKEIGWEDPAILKAIQKWDQLVKMGAFAEDMATMPYDAFVELFNSGAAAMRAEPTWAYEGITLEQDNLDFFMLPTETGELVRLAYGSYANGNAIATNTEYPEEAFQFLCWMTMQSGIYYESIGTTVDIVTGKEKPELPALLEKSNAIANDFTNYYADPYAMVFFDIATRNALKEECGKLETMQTTPEDFVATMASVWK